MFNCWLYHIKVISHNILMTCPDISIKCHFVEENMWVNGKHWFFSTKKVRIIFQYHPRHTPVWRKPSPRYVGVAIFEPLWSLLFQKTEGCVGVECYDLYTRTGGVTGVTGPGHTRVSRAHVAYHVSYILHQITVFGLILSLCLYVIHI